MKKKREGKRKESITALSPCDVEFAYMCAFDKCSWSEEGELVGGETPHNSIYTCSVFNTKKSEIFFLLEVLRSDVVKKLNKNKKTK